MSSGLVIRPFREMDEGQVVALWLSVFADDPPWNAPAAVVRRKLRIQRELFLVGELDGRIVATVLAGYDGFRGWIYHAAVAPEKRRKGFGSDIIGEAESRLRKLGCVKINLQVRESNSSAIGFYRALGYKIEERVSMGKLMERR